MTPDIAFKRGQSNRASLPEGKTCGNCINVTRCCSLFGRIPEDEVCDYSPIQFRDADQASIAAPVPVALAPAENSPLTVCCVCGSLKVQKEHAIGKAARVLVEVCTGCLATQVLTPREDADAVQTLAEIGRFAMGRAW